MSIVVKMLKDEHHEIPQPTQPPFLNSSSVSAEISSRGHKISLASSSISSLSTSISLTDLSPDLAWNSNFVIQCAKSITQPEVVDQNH
ncbi:hypothetical protein LOK49_LG03G00281 [Camellia lanceoleosa]|uniref:Uncharacterized protein n=1 Tax=Camellia lanceoleosa TaxID=1840588 RepID=A0ACC0IGT9_9ERIC|nr:hypothetical protein LOK49_LG03G00281 [Camellia lanceoleosa]